jgi:hypothetical protein
VEVVVGVGVAVEIVVEAVEIVVEVVEVVVVLAAAGIC